MFTENSASARDKSGGWEMVKWLERLLLLERTQVQFPGPRDSSPPSIISAFGARGSDALLTSEGS